MIQAEDFRAEVQTLAAVLDTVDDATFQTPTLFKSWTIDDVIGHLYMFDAAALRSLESDDAFQVFFAPIMTELQSGKTLLQAQYPWLNGLKGRALFEAWRENADKVADAYAQTDPKRRLKWAGPEMSALSSVTARQMETWAHGQEVFDVLGQRRIEGDRIRNIVHLGVNTFGWTFKNRGLPIPDETPLLTLTGPSGAIWTWNEQASGSAISGSAVEFAQVVTQVRSVQDTDLNVTGKAAEDWMAMAQCFAGAPEDPPARGARHVQSA